MARLKDFTVRHLRELARKHLGPGHSKLKTKQQLLAALKKIVPGLVGEPPTPPEEGAPAQPLTVGRAGKRAGKAAGKPTRAEKAPPVVVREAAGGARTPKAEIHRFEKPAAPPVERERIEGAHRRGNGNGWVIEARPVAPTGEGDGHGHRLESAGPLAHAAPPPAPREGRPMSRSVAAEPLVEGFFVARIAGIREARRHHLTEDQVPAPAEHGVGLHYREELPPIPLEYQDDRVVLLARDPRTAFAYWDLHPDARRAAFEGLSAPRAVMRILENGHEVRTIELALETRSYYVHELRAGRRYRVELHAVGSDGTSRRIGPASNDVALPPDDVSADTTVRLMRVPWGIPLSRFRESLRAGDAAMHTPAEPPEPLAIMHSRWVPMANSGSWQLQTWIEHLPREAGRLPHLELRESVPGGASSWTLGGASRREG